MEDCPFDDECAGPPVYVRETILDSWRRSRALHVHMDRVELPFVREPNLDTPLTNAAMPVMRALAHDMAQQSVSIILTSADGVVLERMSSVASMNRALDSVQLARGYSYAEEFVGTNGIGTTLETRLPTYVLGSEHYLGDLGRLACAGVPLRHPLTGATLGVLDMTCWAEDANPLLFALAKNAGRQIEDQLLAHTNERETALLNSYLNVARRSSGGVLAIGGDVVLTNPSIRRALDPQDQAILLEHALDAATLVDTRTVVVSLPSGRGIKLTSVDRLDICAGETNVVFQVQLDEHPDARRVRTEHARPLTLPGVVGRSASWQRTCEQVERCHRDQHWVMVEGEPGSGRSTTITAVARHRDPSSRIRILRCEEFASGQDFLSALAEEIEDENFSVVITDIDALPHDILDPLALLLQSCEGSGWIAATVDSNIHDTDVESTLLPFFPHTVTVPALRHRAEDLDDLVPFLLDAVAKGSGLRMSPAAMNQLRKFPWPGNVAQLRRLLTEVVNKQRAGIVGVEALPAECRSTSRRRLSQLEALERDAVVRSLQEARGNKGEAATALGMSRATIYRKIKDYGLT